MECTSRSGYDVSPHDFVKIMPPTEPYFISGIIEPVCGPGTHSVGGICQTIPEPAPIQDDPVPEKSEPVIDPKPEIVCGSGTHSVDGTC